MIKRIPITIIFFTYVTVEICKVTGIVCGPAFQRIFELSHTRLGIILSAVSVGALMSNLGIGHIIHRWGVFAVLASGLTGLFCALVIVLFASGFWSLLLSLIVIGVTTVSIVNANNTLLADIFGDRLRRVIALASGLWFGSSVISSPVIGLWLEAARSHNWKLWSFRVPYIASMFGIFICLVLACKLLKPVIRKAKEMSESQRNADTGQDVSAQSVVTRVRYQWLWMVLLGFCHGTMIVSLAAWVNPMVQEKFAVSDLKGSIVFAMLASGLALGRLTLAAFKFKADNRTLLAFSGIAGGVLLTASIYSRSYLATIVLIAAGGLVASSTAPCLLSIVPIKFPNTKSHIYGYVGASISTAALIAPSLVGVLADSGLSIERALLISPVAALTLGASAMLWKIKDRR